MRLDAVLSKMDKCRCKVAAVEGTTFGASTASSGSGWRSGGQRVPTAGLPCRGVCCSGRCPTVCRSGQPRGSPPVAHRLGVRRGVVTASWRPAPAPDIAADVPAARTVRVRHRSQGPARRPRRGTCLHGWAAARPASVCLGAAGLPARPFGGTGSHGPGTSGPDPWAAHLAGPGAPVS